MIKKQSAEEQLATMQRLIKFGVNEDVAKSSKPVVEFKRKAANGKTYGIIRESTKYYIMEAPQKDTEILAEDFDYIGGFNNRKENEYSSYAKASNALDLKIMSINETVAKNERVIVETPQAKADWEDKITESMRKEINRFKDITANVSKILKEDKGAGQIPSEHTHPEAPNGDGTQGPDEKKANSPFTDTAVAKGEKDFKKEEHDHEKAGTPFDKDGEISNKEMQSDKKPVVKTDATYLEKAEYVPENSVADKDPKGGKVVRVEEGKKKIRIKLTEEQVLAWNDNKDYIDTTHGTEIGSSDPFTDEVGEESNQTEAPTEPIHEAEGDSVVYDHPNDQNAPAPGTSEVGDGDPFEKEVNEDVTADDAAGMPEDDEFADYPFPDVAKADEEGEDYEFVDQLDAGEKEFDDIDLDDIDDSAAYNDDNAAGLDWRKDFAELLGHDVDDDEYEFECVINTGKTVNEEKLDVFGKHPAYRKKPMTTPPNKEVAVNARAWDDKSVEGEEPFGKEIGDSSPFNEIVDGVVESVLKNFRNKKKV